MAKTARFELRLTTDQKARVDQAAEAAGLDASEYVRRYGIPEETPAQTEARGAYRYKWCAQDFISFCSELPELPDGSKFRLEGHLLLIIKEVFATGRVELLALLPKGNYKTTLFAALAVFHALTVQNANCYIGAADKEQANEMYRFATHFAESHPDAMVRLLVRKSTKEIRSLVDQGFIRVLASDDSKQGGKRQGFNPTLALIDELHAHENSNLYVDMRSGLFKRGGMLVTITTAGQDEDTVLGNLRRDFLEAHTSGGKIQTRLKVDTKGRVRRHKDGRLTIARTASGRTVMLQWACTEDDDLDDARVVKLANPASGVTLESIEDALEAPGLTPAQFARYRANVWSQADDALIEEGVWDALNDGSELHPEVPRWVIVDYARKSDSAAVTELAHDADRDKLIPKAHVWAVREKRAGRVQPAAHTLLDEPTIRQSLVREHIRNIGAPGQVLGVIFDPHLFDPEALADEGYVMIEFPQSNQRTVPASKLLYETIQEGRWAHNGDPVLRSHVTSAGTKLVGEGWRFFKAASKKRIDACICLMMGVEKALEPPSEGGFEW